MEEVGGLSPQLIGLIVPIVLIQVGLMVFALVDLLRRERVRALPKWAWALIIILVNIIGPIVYLLAGRED